MISVQDIRDRMASRLDSSTSGVDYFDDVQDYIPAINSSQEWLISLINSIMSDTKTSEEVLKELKVAKVFQTSKYSRIDIDDTFWSIEAVYPLPLTEPFSISINPYPERSLYRSDLIHVRSHYSCKRLSIEEWAENEGNPFKAGNTVKDCCELTHGSNCNIKFGYLNPLEYKGNYNNNTSIQSLEVRPFIPNKLCTIFYIESPAKITSLTDNIRFSKNLFEIIVDKALQFISYSQGDSTNIWQISDYDVNLLKQSL